MHALITFSTNTDIIKVSGMLGQPLTEQGVVRQYQTDVMTCRLVSDSLSVWYLVSNLR